MKNILKKIFKSFFIQLFTFFILTWFIAFAAISWPQGSPDGEVSWGVFMERFDKIRNNSDCWNWKYLAWYDTNFEKICKTVPAWPKGDKWENWIQWSVWPKGDKWATWLQWPAWPAWPQWPKWDSITNWPVLKWPAWPQWPVWPKGDKWDTWIKWPQWPKWDTWLAWPKGDKWATWPQWPAWPKGDKWDSVTMNFRCPAWQFVVGFSNNSPICWGVTYSYSWDVSSRSSCPENYWYNYKTRTVKCIRNDLVIFPDSYCPWTKPETIQKDYCSYKYWWNSTPNR